MNPQNSNSVRLIALALVISTLAFLIWFARSLNPPPQPTPIPSATPTASATPTPTETPQPTATPSPTATLAPTATPTPAPQWRPVVALRHDAFERVMAYFPKRYNPDAQALIATIDCAQIGRWYWLRSGGYVLRALVSDCQNDEHAAAHAAKWGDQETIELEGIVWYGLRLDALPSPVVEIAPVP